MARHDPLCAARSAGHAASPVATASPALTPAGSSWPLCFRVQISFTVQHTGAWEQPLLPRPSVQRAATEGASASPHLPAIPCCALGQLAMGRASVKEEGELS